MTRTLQRRASTYAACSSCCNGGALASAPSHRAHRIVYLPTSGTCRAVWHVELSSWSCSSPISIRYNASEVEDALQRKLNHLPVPRKQWWCVPKS